MAKRKETPVTGRKMRRALTPEARENQLISLAMDRAEEQLMAGTASSQVITYFLKLGSDKERLERERLEEENKLLRAKTEALKESGEQKVMYADAIKAMRKYSGHDDEEDVYED